MTRTRRITIGLVVVAILSLGLTLPASAATPLTRVPEVVGKSNSIAGIDVRASHLVPKVIGGGHGVWAEVPAAGTLVHEGTNVTLHTWEAVPNVVGDTQATAEAALRANGLTYKFVGGLHGIYAQVPKVGSLEHAGTTVTLTTYEEAPNLVGLSIVQAEAILRSRSLVPNVVGSGWGVAAQSLTPGGLIRIASVDTLTTTTPAIILSPTSGPAGTSVTISGTNFIGEGTISNSSGVTFGGTAMNIGNSLTVGSNGTWTAVFTVPNVPYGSKTVEAFDFERGVGFRQLHRREFHRTEQQGMAYE
jgi:beta-lactam-binding protein with PASTA domain